jgi:hypothetical protein
VRVLRYCGARLIAEKSVSLPTCPSIVQGALWEVHNAHINDRREQVRNTESR